MSCSEYREAIFLEDELTREERVKLGAHISSCPECKALLAARRRSASLVRDTFPAALPENRAALTHKIMQALPLKRKSIWERTYHPLLRYTPVAISAVLVGVFLWETTVYGPVVPKINPLETEFTSEVPHRSNFVARMREGRGRSDQLGIWSVFRKGRTCRNCSQLAVASETTSKKYVNE